MGLEAANSESLKRYKAARATPRARMRTSEEDVDAMVEADKAKGSTGEEVLGLASAMENITERNGNGPVL